ncbi:hypothetical protein C8F04DRAFT_1306376 [Mycena alexandri]|uniref:Uncharacterized protein n=1 Tax=Mycena alexandri TaxID=1745969 RepID=A0AAD6S9S8_9AGAR|nr:hypothetical protein C8F04DRAFT_1306376 [Mycena alexandri]
MDVEMAPPNQGTAKRPRDGNEDTTANTAPSKRLTKIHISHAHDAPKVVTPPSSSSPIVDAWTQALIMCNTSMVKVPPARILEHFGTIRADALKEYQDAQKQLQKAEVSLQRFDQACDSNEVPAIVANAIKVPHVQLLKGTPDLDTTDPDVVLAKSNVVDAVYAARIAGAEHARMKYLAQVTHCKGGVDTAKCADRLYGSLTAYSKEIIAGAPGGLRDPMAWDACIFHLRNAFVVELTDLSYDFAAKLRSEALAKDSKADATASAARPIEELLKDGMLPYDKRIEDLEKKLQAATQTPNASSSKSPATSSKTKAPGKEKKQKRKADDKKPRNEAKDAKRANAAGKGTSKDVKKDKKGKGKAKAEPLDSESD